VGAEENCKRGDINGYNRGRQLWENLPEFSLKKFYWKDYMIIFLGTFMYALGVTQFIMPHQFRDGRAYRFGRAVELRFFVASFYHGLPDERAATIDGVSAAGVGVPGEDHCRCWGVDPLHWHV